MLLVVESLLGFLVAKTIGSRRLSVVVSRILQLTSRPPTVTPEAPVQPFELPCILWHFSIVQHTVPALYHLKRSWLACLVPSWFCQVKHPCCWPSAYSVLTCKPKPLMSGLSWVVQDLKYLDHISLVLPFCRVNIPSSSKFFSCVLPLSPDTMFTAFFWTFTSHLKGAVPSDFWACFLGCMDLSRPEREPLVVFKF